MRYMLVNVGSGSAQIDLHHPDKSYLRVKMHRLGADVALSIPRGESIDILPHFGGSLEKAHAAVKHSRDAMHLINPNLICVNVVDDAGNPIDVEKLLSVKGSEAPVVAPKPVAPPVAPPVRTEDATKPDVELSEAIAAQDQFEAAKRGEANVAKTYTKITREELDALSKKDIVKLALKKLDLKIDKNASKEEMIDTILGVQQ